MAQTINSGSLWGKGSPTSTTMNAGTAYTFLFSNTEVSSSAGGSYFTISGKPLKGTISTTAFTSSLVQNDNRISVFVDGTGDQSFIFTPSQAIPSPNAQLQGTGHYTLTITP